MVGLYFVNVCPLSITAYPKQGNNEPGLCQEVQDAKQVIT